MTMDVLGVMVALAFVLALIVGGAWLMRRLSGPMMNQDQALRVLASAPVGQRERVVLLQAGEQQYLLGVAPGQVRLLSEPQQSIPVSDQQAFAQTLGQMLQRGKS